MASFSAVKIPVVISPVKVAGGVRSAVTLPVGISVSGEATGRPALPSSGKQWPR